MIPAAVVDLATDRKEGSGLRLGNPAFIRPFGPFAGRNDYIGATAPGVIRAAGEVRAYFFVK
jgi:hypothetical protein